MVAGAQRENAWVPWAACPPLSCTRFAGRQRQTSCYRHPLVQRPVKPSDAWSRQPRGQASTFYGTRSVVRLAGPGGASRVARDLAGRRVDHLRRRRQRLGVGDNEGTFAAGAARRLVAATVPLEPVAEQSAAPVARVGATVAARPVARSVAGLVAARIGAARTATAARFAAATPPKGLRLVAGEQEGRHGDDTQKDSFPHRGVPPQENDDRVRFRRKTRPWRLARETSSGTRDRVGGGFANNPRFPNRRHHPNFSRRLPTTRTFPGPPKT